MKRVLSHAKRLFKNHELLWILSFCILNVFALIVFFVFVVISLLYFSDPIEKVNPEKYFTKDELKKLESGKYDDNEEYLRLQAKVQTFNCPIKLEDGITIWNGSEVTNDAFINNYEIKFKWYHTGEIDFDILRNNIVKTLNREDEIVQCIAATNRKMIFRYHIRKTNTIEDIVISAAELNNKS